jgi:hypothetical protein
VTTAPPAGTPEAASAPSTSSPARPERTGPGWIEIGVGVMVMPLTLTIMAMLAPVLWFAGARPRR